MNKKQYTTLEAPLLERKSLADCLVLIVDDEASSRLLLSSVVETISPCITADTGESIIELCHDVKPDLVILDLHMPGTDGTAVCEQLKSSKLTADIPVLFVTGSAEPESQDRCWQVGASDFTTKPIVASTLAYRVKNLLQSKLRLDLLRELTFTDHLTGLYNRYYLYTEVSAIKKQAARERQSVAVIVIDIDFFKGFNDSYGHVEGDECLRSVANALSTELKRPSDIIIRFGGEEFVVFMPNTDESGCRFVGQNMIDSVKNLNITNQASPYSVVTISAGYTVVFPDTSTTLDGIIEKADLHLLDAKTSGKCQLKG